MWTLPTRLLSYMLGFIGELSGKLPCLSDPRESLLVSCRRWETLSPGTGSSKCLKRCGHPSTHPHSQKQFRQVCTSTRQSPAKMSIILPPLVALVTVKPLAHWSCALGCVELSGPLKGKVGSLSGPLGPCRPPWACVRHHPHAGLPLGWQRAS